MIRVIRPAFPCLPRPRQNLARFFAPLITICCAASALAAGPEEQTQTLRGHVPSIVTRTPALGRVPASKTLRLVIGLPLHNQTTLTQLLGDLYDPTSPGYHRYLTPDQFTERFGPTTAEYQAVVAFAKSSHLTIRGAYPNRTMLSVEGTVADIENAFHINLHYYQHPTENRQFFAPDKEPSVASGLPILDIQGLSSF